MCRFKFPQESDSTHALPEVHGGRSIKQILVEELGDSALALKVRRRLATVWLTGRVEHQIVLEKAILLIGNLPEIREVRSNAVQLVSGGTIDWQSIRFYTIGEGENLADLAYRHYRRNDCEVLLREFNREVLGDHPPKPGCTIRIPPIRPY